MDPEKRIGRKAIYNKIILGALIFILVIAVGAAGYIYFRLSGLSNDAVNIAEGSANISFDEPDLNTAEETPDEENSEWIKQDIYYKDVYDENIINVLVIGADTYDENSSRGRSDTMILLSYNVEKRTAKLISFMRDTLVPIEGHGWSRLNHSYSYGGVGLCVNTINANFDLDIQKYIIVNFDSMVNLVDMIGGVDVDLTHDEAELYSWYYGWDVSEGVNHLTGDMALKHARLRALDSDFERTRRQRDILEAVYGQVKKNITILNIPQLINIALDKTKTNMPALEILLLAKDLAIGGKVEVTQGRVPKDGTWESANYKGMSILKTDIEANREYLHKLIYEE